MHDGAQPSGFDDTVVDSELSLVDYLAILRRQRVLILAVVALVVLAAGVFTFLQDPVYEAQARVLVRTNNNQQLFPVVGGSSNLVRSVDAELEYASGDSFQNAAEAASPPEVSVEVERVGDPDDRTGQLSGLIRFRARGGDKEAVAEAANAWAQTYVSARHELERSEIDSAIARDEALLADLQAQREEIMEPLQPLDDAIEDADDPTLVSALLAQRSLLEQSLAGQLAPIEQQISQLNSSLSELRLSASYLDDPEVAARVASEATVPGSPVEPSWTRNIVLAVVVGLVLGVGAGLLRESVGDRLDGAHSLERSIGVPVFAEVPSYNATAMPFPPQGSPPLERYRDISTSLELLAIESHQSYVVLVTSAEEGVGKTTLVANVARHLAEEGRTVLIVSGDLRRPAIEEMLEVSPTPGMVDILLGATDLFAVLQGVDEHLFIIPSGRPVADPGVLLRVPVIRSMRDHIEVAGKFDVVLIDAPPVLAVADPLRLAGIADGVILVARAGSSKRRELAEAATRLRQVDARIVGGVVTGTKTTRSKYAYS